MPRKYMILPNSIVLACAAILFYRTFLAGHITWIGSLVTLSPSLALAYCLIGRMPRYLRYFSAILNAALFFNCGYAFLGTVNFLAWGGALDWRFFLMICALWGSSLGTAFAMDSAATHRICAVALNVAFSVIGALGLYVRLASGWAPWMTAVLFAAFIAVAGLNVCLLVNLFAFRKQE